MKIIKRTTGNKNIDYEILNKRIEQIESNMKKMKKEQSDIKDLMYSIFRG